MQVPPGQAALVAKNRVAAATAAASKRTTVSGQGGYTSALELKSASGIVGVDSVVRVASAPAERQKRITFAPDVTGEGVDDVDISNS
ncbi:hypothetical protein HDU98_010846, partial [Podochytrium sp. JEL0797]